MPTSFLVAVFAAALMVGIWSPAASAASGDAFDTTSDELGRYRASLGERTRADAASLDRVSTSNVSTLIWVAQPVWSAGDPAINGGLCRGWRYVAAGSEAEAEELREQGQSNYLAVHTMLLSFEAPDVELDVDCEGNPAAEVPAPVLRDAVRTAVTGQLPRPDLYIAPGFALTGLETYLDTGALHGLTYDRLLPVVIGPFSFDVEVSATGQTTVDWGDGTPPITYDVPGGPYPDGQIRHTYRDASNVTVTVTDSWIIDFRATTAGGAVLTDTVIAELDQVVIEDFEVREFRAVRTSR